MGLSRPSSLSSRAIETTGSGNFHLTHTRPEIRKVLALPDGAGVHCKAQFLPSARIWACFFSREFSMAAAWAMSRRCTAFGSRIPIITEKPDCGGPWAPSDPRRPR
jgi:hypothetical protein